MRVSSKIVLVLAGALLSSACTRSAADFVGWRSESIEKWQTSDYYVKLQYPVIVGAESGRLNGVIQSWIGQKCALEPGNKYSDAKTCLAGLWEGCSYANNTSLSPRERACTVNVTANVQWDAAGLMVIKMDIATYGGGAHDVGEVHALNLDLHEGRALQFNDLLEHPNTETLALRITHAMRLQRHIPADQPLTQAGFLTDKLPVPTTVMLMPEGLTFIYQSYEVAAYSEGRPQVLVPFQELSDMMNTLGPLSRLHALMDTQK